MQGGLSTELRAYLESVAERVNRAGLLGVPEHEATAYLVGRFALAGATGGLSGFLLSAVGNHAVETVAALRRAVASAMPIPSAPVLIQAVSPYPSGPDNAA